MPLPAHPGRGGGDRTQRLGRPNPSRRSIRPQNWLICVRLPASRDGSQPLVIVPRALPVRDIPARSLAVSMADQSQGHGNGSRQVARSRSCRWRAELGPSARAYCAGSAPTLYSSQVQQQARIPAHYGEPLRTTERTLTWPYAGMHVHVPVSGGQGVAGSNPAVPTGKGYFSLRRSGANSGANRFPGVRLSRLGGLRDRLPFIGAAPLVSVGQISCR